LRLEVEDDAAPFHFGFLEVEEEAEVQAGGSEVVQALSQVLVGEVLDALQLECQGAFDQDVGVEVADALVLLAYGEGGLWDG